MNNPGAPYRGTSGWLDPTKKIRPPRQGWPWYVNLAVAYAIVVGPLLLMRSCLP